MMKKVYESPALGELCSEVILDDVEEIGSTESDLDNLSAASLYESYEEDEAEFDW